MRLSTCAAASAKAYKPGLAAADGVAQARCCDRRPLQVDTYSNILYVKEAKRALSALAHKCVDIDKYRPESCCVIGNYYVSRPTSCQSAAPHAGGQHGERARCPLVLLALNVALGLRI